MKATTKPHQLFVGCPFRKAIRKNYDRLKFELENESPLHIVLADTTSISSTDYLLEHITTLIRESASCVFDATDGNPNVSLEVGVAHALPAEFVLALYTRKERIPGQQVVERALAREGERKPIISDLQGRNRVEYKTYASLKSQIVSRHLERLPYWKRWIDFKRRHASYAGYAIQAFSEIRSSGRSLRPRVEAILDGSGIGTSDLVTALVEAKLLVSRRGRDGGYYYPAR